MRRVRTHRFNGVKFNINVQTPVDGYCESPRPDKKYVPELCVTVDIDTKLGLDRLIHESLHASRYTKNEAEVTRTATEIADFLWRLGFRRKQ